MTTSIDIKETAQPRLDLHSPLPSTGESETILSTLNTDGSRRWIKPRPSSGRFLHARRIVAYLLIAIFTLLPYIHINSKPAVLLDITTRRFTLFGKTFLPSDTLPLALLLVTVFVCIFLLTSLFGRVWCGWGCPQTVYLEFLYRPLERFFEGTPGRSKKGILQTTALGSILKYSTFFLASCFLAHTFLAYFVGVERLLQWVQHSPVDHPTPFLVMAFVTVAMLFDFVFFREQTCIVACPYGRFQSALLDRNSLIVSYDPKRGEPRGRRSAKSVSNLSLPVLGDCVDCSMCVATCPTGIDIRNGLQMECIHCTQCIDACDAVMTKLGKPRGLIRYASQAVIAGEKHRALRLRPIVYSLILFALVSGFIASLLTTSLLDVTLIRSPGLLYSQNDQGLFENRLQIKITNKDDQPAAFTISLDTPSSAQILIEHNPITIEPGKMITQQARIIAPASAFHLGKSSAVIRVSGVKGVEKQVHYNLFGPPDSSSDNPSEKSISHADAREILQ